MKRLPHSILAASFGALVLTPLFGAAPSVFDRFNQHRPISNLVAPTQLSAESIPAIIPKPTLDRAVYDRKLLQLAQVPDTTTKSLWPATAPYPNYGALLPFNRIVAYYGNFLSKGMGVLGEYPEDVMITKLNQETQAWSAADPTTPVIPGIDYIAITAQLSAGPDGSYRRRMPPTEINKALTIANKINGIVILEIQPGQANLMSEIRSLEPYLKQPRVHLAIDPEFVMPKGSVPGTRVGTVDANDINAAANYLAGLVQAGDLPPKILIVHRYTRAMVTNAAKIAPLPEVQIVMDMDGWGGNANKLSTYSAYIHAQPVQFTGFKLFYKNDIRQTGSHLFTPAEILKLVPQPSFIQYQ